MRLESFALLAALLAAPLGAQVVETPQPFDAAGRVTRITPAVADSLGLRPPAWPVTGGFVAARLYRQSSGGYVLVVERPDGGLERIAMLDETVATLRGAVDRPGQAASTSATAVVTATTAPTSAAPATAMPSQGTESRRHPNAAPVSEVMGSQILLGIALYGPLASSAINPRTRDATIPYLAYLAGVGGSVLVGTRLAESGRVTRSQNALATHMAVHGAAGGATLLYALGGDGDEGGYALAGLAGSVAGTALGMVAGRSLDQSAVASSLFLSDLFLLDGYLLTAAQSDPDHDIEVSHGEAAGLIAATLAGYAAGPLYSRVGGRYVTGGDAAVLGVGAGVGMLTSLAIVGDNAKRRRTSQALLVGANAGVLAADLFLSSRFDYTLREGGLMAAAAGAGAFALLQFPGVDNAYEDDDVDTDGDGFNDSSGNDHRALTFAAVGSVGGVLLMHRALHAARDRRQPTRVGAAPPPAEPSSASRRHALSLTGLSVMPDLTGAGRVHVGARLAF